MTVTIDLTPEQRDTVLQLLARHLPNTEAWAYGSRVKWTSRTQSDLDLVVFAKPQQARAVSDLREAYEESNLPFRVDLFVWDEVPEAFREQIERGHVVLVSGQDRMQTVCPPACDWPTATIEEVSEKVAMGPFGSSIKVETFVPEGVPIISGQHLHGIRVDDKPGFNFIAQEHAKRLKNSNVRRGDVVFTHAGNIGQVAYVPECSSFDRYVISQRQFYMRCDQSKVIPEFVTLYFTSSEGQHKLLANASQVGVPSIAQPVTYLRTIEIPVPPLPEQRAIAHILGTLDDKIELNRRMNRTLEAMARALFKSWFVDFDPVRAKMALQQHDTQKNYSPLKESGQDKDASPPARRWGEVKRQYTRQTLQRARTLRQNRTDAEGLLWQYLRNKQLAGHKFRRQQSIGPYIVDFACMAQRLLVELDGGQHAEEQTYDQERDAFLRARGYNILRFWNNEVFENCFAVLERIYSVLSHYPIPEDRDTTHHSPMETENLTPEAQKNHSPLEGESAGQGRSPQSLRWGDAEAVGPGASRPPTESAFASGSTSSTPPQGGSDWTAERARAYLDNMDEEIIALFPDRLVDSKLGEIPEGWEVKSLNEIAEFLNGLALQKFPASDSGNSLPVIKIAELRGGITSKSNRSSRNIPVKYIVKDGDFLFSWSGSLVAKFWTGGEGALNQHLFKVTSDHYPAWFFSQWVYYHLEEFQAIADSKATTMGHIQRGHLRDAVVNCPPEDTFPLLDKSIGSLVERAILNELENGVLTQTRDTLLPKLISGEIRLSDAGKWASLSDD